MEAIKKKRVNGRNKGNSFERSLVKIFKEIGFTGCTTSRYSSKEMDDKKVDLCGLPGLSVQAKAVEQKLCYHTILDSMPQDENLNLIFHKRNGRGTVVSLRQKDFLKILSTLIELGHLKTT